MGGSEPKVPIFRVNLSMLWDSVGGLPGTFPNSNILVHDNTGYNDFVLGL